MVGEALLSGFVGSLLWLDRFQIFQIMISRPIVAGPIVGWVVGDLASGVASGLLYELLWLRRPPVGGFIAPDAPLAAVATASVAAIVRSSTGGDVAAVSLLCFLFLFPVSLAGIRMDARLRRWLGTLASAAEQSVMERGEEGLFRYFVAALLLGFATAFSVLFPTILVASALLSQLVAHIPAPVNRALTSCFYLVPLVGVADLMVACEERRNWALFAACFALAFSAGFFLKLVK